jgi:tRNA(adenine34) deaminase
MEPCVMCAGAIVQARIPHLVYGAPDDRAGGAGTLYNVCEDPRLNHCVQVTGGVLEEEALDLLRQFFEGKR